MIGLAGRRIIGARTGLIAAGLAAIYPGLWQFERELLSEVALALLIALVLYLAYRYIDSPSLAGIVLLCVVCALLALTRAEQTLLFLVLVVPLALRTRTVAWKRRAAWLSSGAAAAVCLLAPWSVYNSLRFDQPVFLSTGLGGTMAAGACETVLQGDQLGHYDNTFCEGKVIAAVAGLDAADADLRMRRFALDSTRDHLDRLPVVLAAREGRTFSLYRPFQEVELGAAFSGSDPWVGYWWTVMYWILLPFAVAGVVALRRRRIPVYPLLVEFLVVAIAAAISFGLIRYRAAAEVPLLILAAVGIDAAWRWWQERRSRPAELERSNQPETVVAG
jgi:4-amino-4-deoxy-L-arabinose transferase-like glycosyltransferase